jgi:hypothetical protein
MKNVTEHLLRHAEWIWYEAISHAQKQANKKVRYQSSAFTCDADYSTYRSRNFPFRRESLTSASCWQSIGG